MGGFAQLGAAFLGYAIGGASIAVILLAVDAVVAFVGAAIVSRWTTGGMVLIAIAAVGALIALFVTTLLEIGVALLLFASLAAIVSLRRAVR